MATAPYQALTRRHALGMPAGSVRALLAFGILGILWLIALYPVGKDKPLLLEQVSLTFIYLQFLMFLILGHFLTAHGHNIGASVTGRSPLGLPTGSVRFLLLAGYLGLAAYLYQTKREFTLPETGPLGLWLLVLISAYFVGNVLTGMVRWMSGGLLPYWFQDIEAWIALLAAFLLGAVMLVRLVINPGLEPDRQITLDYAEGILAGLVGFYFGARS